MVGVAQRPAVVEWKGGHNVTWDACSKNAGRGGGRERGPEWAGLQTLLEMETLDTRGQDSIGATTLVVNLAKAFEKVQLNEVWPCILTFHKEC